MNGTTEILATCRYCGTAHRYKCPLVKAIEYYPDGQEKRVEFYSAQDYLAPTVAPAAGQPIPYIPPIIPDTTWCQGKH